MNVEQTLQIPSFTLYPVTTQDLKTCYESEEYKVLCSLNGPYFDHRLSHLEPFFNIRVTQAQHGSGPSITQQQLIRIEKKLQQVLNAMLVSDKYLRMIFDINIEIIQSNPYNPILYILSPLINLLSYTAMLKCLEIKSAFSCSAASLYQEKLVWSNSKDSLPEVKQNFLVFCTDMRDQRVVLAQFQGEYSFSNYEKLASALQESNDELNRFQLQKVGQVYDLFHQ